MKFFEKNKNLVIAGLVILIALYYYFKIYKPKQEAKNTKKAPATSGGGGGAVGGGISVDPTSADELVNLGMEDELNTSDNGVDTPISMTGEQSGGDAIAVEDDATQPILTEATAQDLWLGGGSTYAITGDYCKTASGGDGKVNNYGECEAFDYSTQTQTS